MRAARCVERINEREGAVDAEGDRVRRDRCAPEGARDAPDHAAAVGEVAEREGLLVVEDVGVRAAIQLYAQEVTLGRTYASGGRAKKDKSGQNGSSERAHALGASENEGARGAAAQPASAADVLKEGGNRGRGDWRGTEGTRDGAIADVRVERCRVYSLRAYETMGS